MAAGCEKVLPHGHEHRVHDKVAKPNDALRT